jgi:hypothetical protein
VSPILSANEEPQERPALPGAVIADRTPQHWILALERVEDRSLGNRRVNLQRKVSVDARQISQMVREYHLNSGCS